MTRLGGGPSLVELVDGVDARFNTMGLNGDVVLLLVVLLLVATNCGWFGGNGLGGDT